MASVNEKNGRGERNCREGRRPRILVADDHEEWLFLWEELLTEDGYEVVVVRSGDEALRLARQSPPDFIILGLSRWQVNSVQTARQLRQSKIMSKPILLVTSDVPDTCPKWPDPHFDGCFDRQDLLTKLLPFLRSHLISM
jgi:CheY-like chemotaxis protein